MALLRSLFVVSCAVALVACSAPSGSPPAATEPAPQIEHHVAVPAGAAADVLASAGVDYRVRLLRRGSDAVATLVVDGEVVAEERWVDGRYYQRSVGTAALAGDDRWVTVGADDPALASLRLGLDELAEHGGRDEAGAGPATELVASPTPVPARVVIAAPPEATVVPLVELAGA